MLILLEVGCEAEADAKPDANLLITGGSPLVFNRFEIFWAIGVTTLLTGSPLTIYVLYV